jgi:hypothetical protein
MAPASSAWGGPFAGGSRVAVQAMRPSIALSKLRNDEPDMVPLFTLSFLDLIESELQRASKGLSSSHYLHNVRSGIANIVALIEYDDEIADAADHLIRMAAGYINRHNPVSITVTEQETRADADRFRNALAALGHFRAALERARPNSRVHTLGLR